MFQIKSRTATLTFNDTERAEINAQLQEFQELTGIECTMVKEMFSELLRIAITELKNTAPVPETDTTTEETKDGPTYAELVQINADLIEENIALTGKVELLENVELEVPEAAEFTPSVNDVYLKLPENHSNILRTIAENRHKAGHDTELATISEVAHKLIFNRGTLYNWGGEVYTGLK